MVNNQIIEDNTVKFNYKVGQEVFFVYKDYPKKGKISEIKISIKNVQRPYGYVMFPCIEYLIKDQWFDQSKLYVDRKSCKDWINHNLFYHKEIENNYDTGYWIDKSKDPLEEECVKVFNVFERTNNGHPWKKRKIVEIFRFVDGRGFIQYVPYEDITLTSDVNDLKGTKYDVIHIYGEHYIEDEVYNFVNYQGIKF